MLGVLTLAEALRVAMQSGMDLVEVNPKTVPPVCKVMRYAAYVRWPPKPR